mmetsp:Transcript_20568/g.33337  ORF Transcript_20568/g.33337 Transcript_20568/m.33337 type:complete len:218 (+) Transcript_20568:2089-2742(+)
MHYPAPGLFLPCRVDHPPQGLRGRRGQHLLQPPRSSPGGHHHPQRRHHHLHRVRSRGAISAPRALEPPHPLCGRHVAWRGCGGVLHAAAAFGAQQPRPRLLVPDHLRHQGPQHAARQVHGVSQDLPVGLLHRLYRAHAGLLLGARAGRPTHGVRGAGHGVLHPLVTQLAFRRSAGRRQHEHVGHRQRPRGVYMGVLPHLVLHPRLHEGGPVQASIPI